MVMVMVVDTTDTVEKKTHDEQSNEKTKKEVREVDPPMKLLKRLIDPNEPWVLVPNGSMMGFFNFVSKVLSFMLLLSRG